MSNSILSLHTIIYTIDKKLTYYHTIDIYNVLPSTDSTYMILGHMCLLWDLHFTLLYVVVSQQFDKHLYLTQLSKCT